MEKKKNNTAEGKKPAGVLSGEHRYLACEHRGIFALLMINAGMMGAYTFQIRGGVFCNAQTANFVMMSIAFGKGNFSDGFYFLVPITAYFLGTIVSELIPLPLKKLGLLRWDTCLVLIEAISLFAIGFLPLSFPNHFIQVVINFLASMQYNTFRQADGVPMATTFLTNHVRQVGIAVARIIRKKDSSAFERALLHIAMIFCFAFGAFCISFGCRFLQEKSIWLALVPLLIIFFKLAYADLIAEKEFLHYKPLGH